MQVFEIQSEALEQKIKVYVDNFGHKTIRTADGVDYTESELNVLIQSRKPIPKAVHIVKKVLGGRLIYQEPNIWQKRDGSS